MQNKHLFQIWSAKLQKARRSHHFLVPSQNFCSTGSRSASELPRRRCFALSLPLKSRFNIRSSLPLHPLFFFYLLYRGIEISKSSQLQESFLLLRFSHLPVSRSANRLWIFPVFGHKFNVIVVFANGRWYCRFEWLQYRSARQ